MKNNTWNLILSLWYLAMSIFTLTTALLQAEIPQKVIFGIASVSSLVASICCFYTYAKNRKNK